MRTPVQPHLQPGKVYRTSAFARWSANAPRLAKRLVASGKLMPLAHGLYAVPVKSRFGPAPPSDKELMRGFLDGEPFVFTGPERWNALGLGSTALFARQLVYNTKRSGTFDFGGRRFVLRRVKFPTKPTPEWFVVDLFENASQAGVSSDDLAASLRDALRRGQFDARRLREAAESYGTIATQQLLEHALAAAGR